MQTQHAAQGEEFEAQLRIARSDLAVQTERLEAQLRVARSENLNEKDKLLRDAIDRAGIKAWEKPFVNLRASAITDFRRTGVSPVQVGDWTGNSTRIADKHYDLPFADQFICAVNLPLHLPDYPRAG